MNKLLSVLCALTNYCVILFEKGKCHFRSNGRFWKMYKVRMNFLAIGLCIEISTGLLYYYMKLHNAWLLKTSKKTKKKNKQ